MRLSRHEVEIVHHPDQALALLGEFRPEIAVLDLGLPGMDGVELAGRIHARIPACRLIALTGYGQDTDRARTAAAGFSAHLIKPVDINALLALLGHAA